MEEECPREIERQTDRQTETDRESRLDCFKVMVLDERRHADQNT